MSAHTSASSAAASSARAHRKIAGPLVIATHNPGKLAEMGELLLPYGVQAVAAGALGLSEPDENGATFRENARHKAICAASRIRPPGFRR